MLHHILFSCHGDSDGLFDLFQVREQVAEVGGGRVRPTVEHTQRREVTGIEQAGGFSVSNNRWAVQNRGGGVDAVAPLSEAAKKQKRAVEIEDEFTAAWNEWSLLEVDWKAFYPDDIPTDTLDIDCISHLMKVDIGVVMRLLKKDKKYGLIPVLAGGCMGQIGALNSESFCERILSQASLILDEGNTLMTDEVVEMLTVLRMSSEFMLFMSDRYSSVVKQQFGETVVEEEKDE